MCKITIMDGITADARVEAEVYIYDRDYKFDRKGDCGHIRRKVRDLFRGIDENKRYMLHIDQELTFNGVTYTAPRINVTPGPSGFYEHGHAWMQSEPPLTKSAREKAEPICAAALAAVQKQERQIIEEAKREAADRIAKYADDLIATAQAAQEEARAAQ